MLMLDSASRMQLWQRVIDIIETYWAKVDSLRVAPDPDTRELRSLLQSFDFDKPLDPAEAVDLVVRGLLKYQTHSTNPRYFGLFNPAPTTMGIVGDLLAAAFDPQLATSKISPFPIELERMVIRAFGIKFGYDESDTDGTFTSGGAEANFTALITALARTFPDFTRAGLRALPAQPVFYISSEGHHSFLKAARMSGLGADAVREVAVDDRYKMDAEALLRLIEQDEAAGYAPFMIVATAGTTNAGIIDPLARVAEIAADKKIWLHVDAAWGGAAALAPELCSLFEGIERADSITLDPHKWLSVPKGAGLYLTRHTDVLDLSFHIQPAYMPSGPSVDGAIDPYMHSAQWSRRFIGLKVFLSLIVAGWEGYARTICSMVTMGEYLKQQLGNAGWEVVNQTRLPVACFTDLQLSEERESEYLQAIVGRVLESGWAWISFTRLNNRRPVIRACITNHRTKQEDVDLLINALDSARAQVIG